MKTLVLLVLLFDGTLLYEKVILPTETTAHHCLSYGRMYVESITTYKELENNRNGPSKWMLHGAWVLPGCFLGASWVPPGCLLGVSWVLPWSPDVSQMPPRCLSDASQSIQFKSNQINSIQFQSIQIKSI